MTDITPNPPAATWTSPPQVTPADLPDWLISHGQHWATLHQVSEILDVPESQVAAIMRSLQAKGRLIRPTSGAYVPVPAEFWQWGTVPASHFIDPLMVHLGHPYYVGLLSAAEIHGASHQRPQVFQVVTPVNLRAREIGRTRIQFVRSVRADRRPTLRVNTPTGTMRVSTVEVTLLDLVNWPRLGGGLSNVATVIAELLEEDKINVDGLVVLAANYPSGVVARAGWLLDFVASQVDASIDTDALAEFSVKRKNPVPLAANGRRAGVRDRRWNVVVNDNVEPDL